MKALSLTQPWATLIAIGAKRIETRSWSTRYRGTIAIQAASRMPASAVALCYEDPFVRVLTAAGYDRVDQLPRGAIIAIVGIDEVFSTNTIDAEQRLPRALYHLPHEREFGDYSDDRFGWVLRDVERLREPIPCKGALGLWTVPPAIAAALSVREEALA